MNGRILIALLLPASCDGTGYQGQASAASPPRDPGPPAVEVVPIVARRIETTTRLPAEISAYETVALYPRVSGFVDEILVDRGSAVRKGQLLARLSAPEVVAQRAEAQSRVAAARSTYERTRAAAATPGAVAKHDLEVAAAELEAEQARLAALQTLESYLVVRAPFDGMITARNVHPGALVGPPAGPGMPPMVEIQSTSHLRVTVAVPEVDASAVANGASAAFQVRAWPGQTFSGVIRRISHSLDARTRTMPVELDYANDDGRLAPGMYAEVTWPIRRESPSLLVPSSAVVQTPDETYVDHVKDGALDRVRVRRGTAIGGLVEVFASDLAAGDLVLKRGSEELANGSRVRARAAPGEGGRAE